MGVKTAREMVGSLALQGRTLVLGNFPQVGLHESVMPLEKKCRSVRRVRGGSLRRRRISKCGAFHRRRSRVEWAALPFLFMEPFMLRKFMRGALYVAFAMVALWIAVNVIALAKYALS